MNRSIEKVFDNRSMRIFFDEDGTFESFEIVAKDVCAVLGLERVDSALRGLDDDEKGTHTVSTPGGPQEMQTLTLPGFLTLVLRSNKPIAKPYRKWVTGEVLPEIFKTGSYQPKRKKTPSVLLREAESTFRASLRLAKLVGLDKKEHIEAANYATKELTGFDLLKLLHAVSVPVVPAAKKEEPEKTEPVTDIRDKKYQRLTPSQLGKKGALGSGIKVNKLLEKHGYQEALTNSKKRVVWSPTVKGQRFSCYKEIAKADSTPGQQLLWYSNVIPFLQNLSTIKPSTSN